VRPFVAEPVPRQSRAAGWFDAEATTHRAAMRDATGNPTASSLAPHQLRARDAGQPPVERGPLVA